jgi:LigD, primase-polymerase domain
MAGARCNRAGQPAYRCSVGPPLFPDDDITKGDLVEYYRDVAGRVLPYLSERPIVMARYPDGLAGQRVFQKNVPGYFPDWVSRAEVKKAGGSLTTTEQRKGKRGSSVYTDIMRNAYARRSSLPTQCAPGPAPRLRPRCTGTRWRTASSCPDGSPCAPSVAGLGSLIKPATLGRLSPATAAAWAALPFRVTAIETAHIHRPDS